MAPRRGPQEVEEGRAERETISLVMQGELSRAIRKLESGAMAIPGPQVWDELVRLHPGPTPGFERPLDPGVPAMTLNGLCRSCPERGPLAPHSSDTCICRVSFSTGVRTRCTTSAMTF